MSVVVHDRIGPIAAEWDELADELGAPPWLRPGWFGVWADAFQPGPWRIHALRDGGRLVGVVPLVRGRFGLASASNWHTPEFGMLARDGAHAELAHCVVRAAYSTIALSFVDEVQPWAQAARECGHRVLARPLERSPYVELDQSWEAYEAGLGRKLRSELRRRARRLAEEGAVEFELCEGGDCLAAVLEDGFRVEAAGWKGQRGSAIASQSATLCFYRELAHWAADRGMLRLALLRVGGRAIAFDFALEDAGVHALLKTGFDPAYGKWAPGMLLRHEMLRRAFAVGLRRYDFLGADEPWKLEWTSTTRERRLVQVFARSMSGRVTWNAYARGRPLAKRVLQAVGR